ncbi:MAG: 3'-5' exonuclease [Bacteroidales bacterium]|nr:3'-5' exonuclease [Bacteroidales bacterium]
MLQKILFLDIETVPEFPSYEELPDRIRFHWDRKVLFIRRNENETPSDIYERAGIYAEFGKIVCVAMGYVNEQNVARIRSFVNTDERALLQEIADIINRFSQIQFLCAHNGKEFDFPFLCRRMIIHHIPIPPLLNVQGKKSWETTFIDTMELWKFGDYKHFTSLDLLATVLGVSSSKDDMDGSQVRRVYYEERDLDRIAKYCQQDVSTLIQVFCRLMFIDNPLTIEFV